MYGPSNYITVPYLVCYIHLSSVALGYMTCVTYNWKYTCRQLISHFPIALHVLSLSLSLSSFSITFPPPSSHLIPTWVFIPIMPSPVSTDPRILRFPRSDETGSFVLVHVSCTGPAPLDLTLTATEGESPYVSTGGSSQNEVCKSWAHIAQWNNHTWKTFKQRIIKDRMMNGLKLCLSFWDNVRPLLMSRIGPPVLKLRPVYRVLMKTTRKLWSRYGSECRLSQFVFYAARLYVYIWCPY